MFALKSFVAAASEGVLRLKISYLQIVMQVLGGLGLMSHLLARWNTGLWSFVIILKTSFDSMLAYVAFHCALEIL